MRAVRKAPRAALSKAKNMVVVIPTNKSVESLEGLHLYHGAISNCSMRVRMTLIEKGLDWTSHHLDLKKKENIQKATLLGILNGVPQNKLPPKSPQTPNFFTLMAIPHDMIGICMVIVNFYTH